MARSGLQPAPSFRRRDEGRSSTSFAIVNMDVDGADSTGDTPWAPARADLLTYDDTSTKIAIET